MTSLRRSTRSERGANSPAKSTRSQRRAPNAKEKEKSISRRGLESKHFQNGKGESTTPDDLDSLRKDEEESGDEDRSDEDAYQEEDAEDDGDSLDSGALDDDDFDGKNTPASKSRSPAKNLKRKRENARAKVLKSGNLKESPKRRRKVEVEVDDDDDGSEDGVEVVGDIVQAPTTGQVPPGQISLNTLNFLRELKDPEKNDREWFKLHDPVYRQAEKEWKDFIEQLTKVLVVVDPQIPHLPPKDVIHRIYRDIRFSNDKTPYKTGFSASFSRSGRKGIFAGYHFCVKPGESFLAAGSWQPGKDELQTIRANLLRSSSRFRGIISSPAFEKLFGEAKPKPAVKGKKVSPTTTDSYSQRRNVFGREDELKVAPKGVAKDHKDIDILKLRSFAVSIRFEDDEVLAKDFKEKLGEVVKVMRPFVRCLNDLMTIPDLDEESSDSGEE